MGDNWETILDVCDKVKAITTGPKDCLRAIIKRLYHQNPHVAKQAVIVSCDKWVFFTRNIHLMFPIYSF